MNQLLHVSASPHIKDRVTTSSIMLDVIIALIPATLFGIIQFKINALLIIVTTITTCVLAEYLYERFMKKTITISSFMASCYWGALCNNSGGAILWRIRTKLYESSVSCKMFFIDFLYWKNDKFCI